MWVLEKCIKSKWIIVIKEAWIIIGRERCINWKIKKKDRWASR